MARITAPKEAWFDIPNDPDGGSVKVRHLKSGEEIDIEDKISRYEPMFRPDASGVMRQEVRVNNPTGDMRYAYLCAAVVDWKNVFGVDGEPLDCTNDNKILLARDDANFGKFVGECRTKLAAEAAQEQEAARKNETTSAAGSPA